MRNLAGVCLLLCAILMVYDTYLSITHAGRKTAIVRLLDALENDQPDVVFQNNTIERLDGPLTCRSGESDLRCCQGEGCSIEGDR